MAGGERNTDAILKSISPKFENSSIVRFISETFNLENVSLDPNVTLGEESKKGDSYLSTITRFSIKATGKQARSTFVIVVKLTFFKDVFFFEAEQIGKSLSRLLPRLCRITLLTEKHSVVSNSLKMK